ncbi:RidA family protein [Sedimentitalea sp. JM2-8]|uniref:RidA family protein n=1 Tax=Sedimentitalea xiamensis TaxID=3050037 RepID=A0ABT7FAY7_9RHOB|nr:RidA family protein [Sedimentitalea xiamensis]MDK3072198.1 RidA family protein [Sedimentitalea xiamensis]
MTRIIDTGAAPASFSRYSQAVEIPAYARMLHVSGQVGISVDGTLPANTEAQHEQAWLNIFAILAVADMSKTDIVDVLAIVSDASGVPVFRQVRDRMLEGHLACSTLLVCGLASPDWKVEIAVKAARAD